MNFLKRLLRQILIIADHELGREIRTRMKKINIIFDSSRNGFLLICCEIWTFHIFLGNKYLISLFNKHLILFHIVKVFIIETMLCSQQLYILCLFMKISKSPLPAIVFLSVLCLNTIEIRNIIV